jgi:hypothetical protein
MRDARGERIGDWMQTFTGRQFFPLDPRADEIDIRDIAHGLAMVCRYNGHCLRFYSVAEHSVLISRRVPAASARLALMHDAGEAYIGDMIRPLKHDPSMAGFRRAEDVLADAIVDRFGIECPDAAQADVSAADTRILIDERDQIMHNPPPAKWGSIEGLEALGVTIEGWTPDEAERMFLVRFCELFPEHAVPVPAMTPRAELDAAAKAYAALPAMPPTSKTPEAIAAHKEWTMQRAEAQGRLERAALNCR